MNGFVEYELRYLEDNNILEVPSVLTSFADSVWLLSSCRYRREMGMSEDRKIRHLEFIQGVINRMGSNSFQVKGWSVILISAILTISIQNENIHVMYVLPVPLLAFWMLDGYFLCQERRFRMLYDYVRQPNNRDIDFSMNIADILASKKPGYIGSILSITLILFYSTLFAICLVIYWVLA